MSSNGDLHESKLKLKFKALVAPSQAMTGVVTPAGEVDLPAEANLPGTRPFVGTPGSDGLDIVWDDCVAVLARLAPIVGPATVPLLGGPGPNLSLPHAEELHDLRVVLRLAMTAAERLLAAGDRREAAAPAFWGPNDVTPRLRVSVVIPAKNESKNLAWVLARLPASIDEVILADGNSTDDTVAVARALRPDVRVIRDDRSGKGAALRAGFKAATGDLIVMLDADGSMDPSEIGRYLSLVDDGFDLVKGSRFMAGGGSSDITRIRRLGNRTLVVAVNWMFRTRFTDLCYGFCAFDRRWLPLLDLDADGFEIETQIVVRAVRAGMRITEVPSTEEMRRSGSSQLRAGRDGIRIARELLRELRHRTLVPTSGDPRSPVIDLTKLESAALLEGEA